MALVILAVADQERAKTVARARIRNGRALTRQRTAPRVRDPWLELDSTGAELALARFLGVEWNAGEDGPEYRGDLANGDEVRFSRLEVAGLIGQDGDRPDARYWLLVGGFPRYRVAGWLYGHELAVYPARAGDRGAGNGYRIAPQSELRPP